MTRLLFAATLLWPVAAYAHAGQPAEPHDLWTAWEAPPLVAACLIVAGILWIRGTPARSRHSTSRARWRAWASCGGFIALFVALCSPVHVIGDVLFAAHMIQHEILIVVAAPAIAYGNPWPRLLRGFGSARHAIGSVLRSRAARAVIAIRRRALAATLLHALAILAWHVPSAYDRAAVSPAAHALQHSSLFLCAIWFWHAMVAAGRAPSAIGYLFVTALVTGGLGALIAFAQAPWYMAHVATTGPWGLTPLQDQQLAGLIMWIPGGLPYVVAGGLCGWKMLSARTNDSWSDSTPINVSVHRPAQHRFDVSPVPRPQSGPRH